MLAVDVLDHVKARAVSNVERKGPGLTDSVDVLYDVTDVPVG